MKKKISLILAMVMMTSLLAGCGSSFTSDENAIYVKKDGSIIQASVETLDQSYYDEDELKDYINDSIDEYKAESDGSVKMQSFKVTDGIASLYLTYDGYETYSDFNGTTLFVGTVAQAIAAGYDFNVGFYTVTDGETGDASQASADASGDASGDAASGDVTSTLDNMVVITSESVQVKVAGTIQYVSATGTKMVSSDTVSVSNVNNQLTYVVYASK